MQSEIERVPFTNDVTISRAGVVYLGGKECPKIKQTTGNVVELNLWRGITKYSVAELMVLTWLVKRDHLVVKNIIQPIFIDGDVCNDDLGNLEYNFSSKASTDGVNFLIPMFSRYTITIDGIVLDENCQVVNSYLTKEGYSNLHLYQDKTNRSKTVGRHRLLCMVFKTYNEPLSKIIVNHKDGVPGSDHIDNLEWTTYTGNINHAYLTGLRGDNKPTVAFNVITKEYREFQSLSTCSRELGFGHDSVRNWVGQDISKLRPGGWLFKLKEDPTPWREVKDPIAELVANGYFNRVKALNVFTREEFVFENEKLASVHTGVKRTTIGYNRNYRLNEGPVKGWLFRNGNDERPWPKYSEFELTIFRDESVPVKPVRIVNTKTGVESQYTSVRAASEILKLSKDHIQRSMSKNSKFGKVYLAFHI